MTTPRQMAQAYAKASKAVAAGERRAVQRAGASVRTAQVREITKTLNVRAAAVNAAITTKRQSGASGLEVVHVVRGEGIPLKSFIGTTQTRKGVNVRVLKGGKRSTLHAAFALGKAGGHYFGRVSQSDRKRYGSPHVGRLPIVKLYGPNILSQYIKDTIRGLGDDTWNRRIEIELERELSFALRKAGVID